MNQENLVKLMEKLDSLEQRLESQEDELVKIVYSKTYLNQRTSDNNTKIETDLRTRKRSIISARKVSGISLLKEKGLIESLKRHFLEWMLVSTWSGPGIIIRVKNIFRKIYWIILFLLCMAATIYVLVLTVNNYMSYSAVSSISETNDAPALFPTVSQKFELLGP